ncbi:MAG: aminoacyl-tRNA hydrolase [Thermoflexibacter sp.]
MKYLVIGLGNIGEEYAHTRHNVGFMVVDKLARQFEVSFESGRYAFFTEIKYKGRSITLIKPTTYMNLSGKAVNYWLRELKIPVENSLTIVDDIAIDFGKIRLRGNGSSAGHNGLKDIEATLETQNYPRLRFGIGNNYPKGRQVEYVLSKFNYEEQKELGLMIEKAAEATLAFCTVGLSMAMNQYNK